MKVYILYISKIYISITGFLGLKKLEKWYDLQMSIFRITIIVSTMATTIMMSFRSLEEVGLKKISKISKKMRRYRKQHKHNVWG